MSHLNWIYTVCTGICFWSVGVKGLILNRYSDILTIGLSNINYHIKGKKRPQAMESEVSK